MTRASWRSIHLPTASKSNLIAAFFEIWPLYWVASSRDCYVTDLAPKCKRCVQPIVENFISALDAYFHPSCFVCVECGVAFNATSFYEYQDMPYCELHYHLKRGSLCNSCSQPINGRCITALNKKYHPEHFNCSFCLQTLNKGTFKTCPNEKPYCHQCFQKLFPI
jgi:paxillin